MMFENNFEIIFNVKTIILKNGAKNYVNLFFYNI